MVFFFCLFIIIAGQQIVVRQPAELGLRMNTLTILFCRADENHLRRDGLSLSIQIEKSLLSTNSIISLTTTKDPLKTILSPKVYDNRKHEKKCGSRQSRISYRLNRHTHVNMECVQIINIPLVILVVFCCHSIYFVNNFWAHWNKK